MLICLVKIIKKEKNKQKNGSWQEIREEDLTVSLEYWLILLLKCMFWRLFSLKHVIWKWKVKVLKHVFKKIIIMMHNHMIPTKNICKNLTTSSMLLNYSSNPFFMRLNNLMLTLTIIFFIHIFPLNKNMITNGFIRFIS